MSNRIAFQTQLASIMEVLANAAVAEICKLVDDDYAVINLQMTQCQRENKALKRKLHILELKMARGFAERRISSLNRTNRVQVSAALSDKYRNQTNDVLYGAQFNSGLWRGGGTDSAAQQVENVTNNMTGDAVLSEADTVLIKDEMFEEDQTQQRLFIRDGGVKEAGFGDVQVVKDDDQVSGMQQPTLEQQRQVEDGEPETIVIKEDLNDQWERSQTQAIIVQDAESNTENCSGRLSTSPAKSTGAPSAEKPIEVEFSHLSENGQDRSQRTNISPSTGLQIQGTAESSQSSSQQHQYHRFAQVRPSKGLTTGETAALTGSGHLHKGMVKSRTSPTNQPLLSREKTATEMSGTDCLLYDRPAEPKSSFTHWPTHPSCSYTNLDQDQDCMLVQSETVSSIRSSKGGRDGASSTRTHAVSNAGAAEGPIREEERWNQAAILRQSQTEASGQISSPEVIQTETAIRTNPSYLPQIMSNLTQPGASLAGLQLPKHMEKGRRKSYVCKYCGKAFTGLSNVVTHQRVHTGERPFKCDTCGKLFTEAGNLKKHQRVHTGEKPFICPRCGKRFAWICNLKTHQQSASCGGV
ncbi:zinc finger and SCAN domain-containing protein 2-like isoform X1 [Sinocyclocheilus grahami]|uniref:zinc finger and SCAN domain-containing protein 2-like isoform X1 n=1 Tax=Sinocyclocheilus grahami TaxID=75366 RepID=UPI0007ACBE78|nr:PREDICTED: zinc finger and SCAN domain-containing protein 2-like isoform X1 [Sinocyclocheilus grahami]